MLVVGLGRRGGGEGAVRWLARERGASVHVLDPLGAEALGPVLARLEGLPGVTYELGGSQGTHDVAAGGWDLLVRNPAVPHEALILAAARAAGIPVHTEASLFVAAFPGTVLGVTGSKGKTSTCVFLHHLLGGDAAGVRLAGNLGGSALDALAGATEATRCVFEFSSFQTETLGERGIAVPIACLTSLHPDHQDRYAGEAAYYAAKAPLFTLQDSDAWRVHHADGVPAGFFAAAPARWCCVGRDHPDADAAVWVEAGAMLRRTPFQATGAQPRPAGVGRRVTGAGAGAVEEVCPTAAIPVDAPHRFDNVLVAVGAASVAGVDLDALRARLATLPDVPHRMEPVPVPGPRRWINDTAATNPTAAAASIRALAAQGPLIVICGGARKGLSLEPLLAALVETRPAVVLLPGAESEVLAAGLAAAGLAAAGAAVSMPEAVRRAAATGDASVLLAPGCSSFAQPPHPGFADEFDRGGQFVATVLRLHGVPVSQDQEAALKAPRRPAIAEILAPGEPGESGGHA